MPRAIWNGAVLAESNDCRQVEGNFYFPPQSLHQEYFIDSSTTSVCGWKGTANYYNVKVGDAINKDAAWVYHNPSDEAKHIADYVAFWRGVQVEA